MTRPRYRRSSVRAVLETLTADPSLAAPAHDALWAALWNRRYDDVDEAVWAPDAVYGGILVFTWRFPQGTVLAGIDTGESLVVLRGVSDAVPIGSRVRVLPADRDLWRFADGIQQVGLGIELRFDNQSEAVETGWIATLRAGLRGLREALEARREQLVARRSQLGARSEPASVDEIWRAEMAAITERVSLETEYTEQERLALSRARAKGPRFADEENRVIAARRKRFTELGNAEVARFRDERWPAIRDGAITASRKYDEYRAEVVRIEDAIQRVRTLGERAKKALPMLDAIERAGFSVRVMTFDQTRLGELGYVEEVLRTIELLHAAVPLRAQAMATRFSAYRAPTAGPAVVPPRLV